MLQVVRLASHLERLSLCTSDRALTLLELDVLSSLPALRQLCGSFSDGASYAATLSLLRKLKPELEIVEEYLHVWDWDDRD